MPTAKGGFVAAPSSLQFKNNSFPAGHLDSNQKQVIPLSRLNEETWKGNRLSPNMELS
jgi:hypothetical protein